MTDTHTNTSTASAPIPSRASARWLKLKIAFGFEPEPSGNPSYIWLERWDALMVAIAMAVGVPLLGASGLDFETKKTIAWVWALVWAPFFVYFEFRELLGQMQGRGSIKPEQWAEQQNTAQDAYFGIYIAVAVWIVVYAIHVTVNVYPVSDGPVWRLIFVKIPAQVYYSWWDSWISYRIPELVIMLQVWLVTKYFNYLVYNVGNTFSKIPLGERIERRVPTGG